MRVAIISDLHANLEATRAVLKEIDKAGVEKIVCLGDVVGYNASPQECVNIIRDRGIPTICGNHDAVASGRVEPVDFNPVAEAAVLWTREHLSESNRAWLRELPVSRKIENFIVAHGTPTDFYTYLFTWEDILPHVNDVVEQNCWLCFFGHTHIPVVLSTDGAYALDDDSRFKFNSGKCFFVNCGSVGQPRDGDPRAAFGLYDSETREYELVRVEYSIEDAANKVLAAGLPEFLAERLFLGR